MFYSETVCLWACFGNFYAVWQHWQLRQWRVRGCRDFHNTHGHSPQSSPNKSCLPLPPACFSHGRYLTVPLLLQNPAQSTQTHVWQEEEEERQNDGKKDPDSIWWWGWWQRLKEKNSLESKLEHGGVCRKITNKVEKDWNGERANPSMEWRGSEMGAPRTSVLACIGSGYGKWIAPLQGSPHGGVSEWNIDMDLCNDEAFLSRALADWLLGALQTPKLASGRNNGQENPQRCLHGWHHHTVGLRNPHQVGGLTLGL